MAFLFDFFPVLLFFAIYKWQGFFVATAVFMVAAVMQIGLYWLKHRQFKQMHLISTALVLVFGGLTLWLQDEQFLKWKVTAVYILFAIGFGLIARFGERRTVVERLMGEELKLPPQAWQKLNGLWIGFFLLLALLNLYIMFNFDTDTWVNFKLYGVMGMTLLFAIVQGIYIMRHMPEERGNTSEED